MQLPNTVLPSILKPGFNFRDGLVVLVDGAKSVSRADFTAGRARVARVFTQWLGSRSLVVVRMGR